MNWKVRERGFCIFIGKFVPEYKSKIGKYYCRIAPHVVKLKKDITAFVIITKERGVKSLWSVKLRKMISSRKKRASGAIHPQKRAYIPDDVL